MTDSTDWVLDESFNDYEDKGAKIGILMVAIGKPSLLTSTEFFIVSLSRILCFDVIIKFLIIYQLYFIFITFINKIDDLFTNYY